MNPLDLLISWVSPSAGLARQRHRMTLDHLRKYEGAKTGRANDGWVTSGTSANAEIAPAAARLRNRSRDLVRNTPWGKTAKKTWIDNTVGTGIMMRANTGDPHLDKQINEGWKRFCDKCDAYGNLDFYGLQAQVAGAEYESGEVFSHFLNRRPDDGLHVPLQLQLLEADYCDSSRQAWGTTIDGYTLQGLEFDKLGQKVGYWLFQQHPGEMIVLPKQAMMSKLVPASEVLQIFWPDRPGQVRGVPRLASVMQSIHDLDDYEVSEQMRKKIESCLVGFVTQEEGAEGPTLSASGPDEKGGRYETFEPGMMGYLKPGQGVTFNQPAASAGYTDYKRNKLHDIAAGADVMYEQMTGDLSQINYSSYRAGSIEFRLGIRAYRRRVLVPQFCAPVWRRFIDTAYVAGQIPKIDYRYRWAAPGFDSVDRKKDGEADTMAVRAGIRTLAQVIAENGPDGSDVDEHLAEIQAMNKKLDALNLILDCDPRKVAKAGGPVPAMEGNDPDGGSNA